MSQHRILLRRAWELLRDDRQRIDLPAEPAIMAKLGTFKLLRRFQIPRIDPDQESLYLRLEDLPGLVSIQLNGQPLVENPATANLLAISLGHRLNPGARATLELTIDLRGWDPKTLEDRPFGNVALVIETRPLPS